jgi:hypothetical protein
MADELADLLRLALTLRQELAAIQRGMAAIRAGLDHLDRQLNELGYSPRPGSENDDLDRLAADICQRLERAVALRAALAGREAGHA